MQTSPKALNTHAEWNGRQTNSPGQQELEPSTIEGAATGIAGPSPGRPGLLRHGTAGFRVVSSSSCRVCFLMAVWRWLASGSRMVAIPRLHNHRSDDGDDHDDF